MPSETSYKWDLPKFKVGIFLFQDHKSYGHRGGTTMFSMANFPTLFAEMKNILILEGYPKDLVAIVT